MLLALLSEMIVTASYLSEVTLEKKEPEEEALEMDKVPEPGMSKTSISSLSIGLVSSAVNIMCMYTLPGKRASADRTSQTSFCRSCLNHVNTSYDIVCVHSL